MSEQIPAIGRIVHYRLSEQDAEHINLRRAHALAQARAQGHPYPVHTGTPVRCGDVYPMIITRIRGDTPDAAVNGQVLLDGTDTLWVNSVHEGDGDRDWVWSPRT